MKAFKSPVYIIDVGSIALHKIDVTCMEPDAAPQSVLLTTASTATSISHGMESLKNSQIEKRDKPFLYIYNRSCKLTNLA